MTLRLHSWYDSCGCNLDEAGRHSTSITTQQAKPCWLVSSGVVQRPASRPTSQNNEAGVVQLQQASRARSMLAALVAAAELALRQWYFSSKLLKGSGSVFMHRNLF